MRGSDYQREENYNEFLRLQQNNDYIDVTYDEPSGGVSAVHKLHKFDKQVGVNGQRRGDYEKMVVDVLRRLGHRVVLEAELSSGPKKCDGLLDDTPMEIKTVEGDGLWSISTKLRNSAQQHAKCVVLFFPEENLYSPSRVSDGIRLLQSNPDSDKLPELSKILAIVSNRLDLEWDKKTTPIEGWSIQEGFRR